MSEELEDELDEDRREESDDVLLDDDDEDEELLLDDRLRFFEDRLLVGLGVLDLWESLGNSSGRQPTCGGLRESLMLGFDLCVVPWPPKSRALLCRTFPFRFGQDKKYINQFSILIVF